MKMKTIAASIVVAFWAGLWNADARSAEWDGKSPVDIPRMKKGDSWVFKGFSSTYGTDIYREKISSISGIGYFTLSHSADKSGTDGSYTVDLKSHKRPWLLFEALDFPLYVGKKWRITYDALSVANAPNSYVNKYKVLKVETKSVKAGRFKALKIRLTQMIIGGQRGIKHIWYAPDVKRIILTKPNWRGGEELISYQLAGKKRVPPVQPPDDGLLSKMPQISEIIFTRELDDNNDPKENIQTFNRGKWSRFFVYVKWDNFTPGKSYPVRYSFVDKKGGDSQSYENTKQLVSTQTIEPDSESYTSWHKKVVPNTSGSWQLEIDIYGNVLGERSFEVVPQY